MTTTATTQSPVHDRQFQVVSASSGKVYTLTFPKDPSLPVYCSCPAWKHMKLPPALRVCKHMRQAKEQMSF